MTRPRSTSKLVRLLAASSVAAALVAWPAGHTTSVLAVEERAPAPQFASERGVCKLTNDNTIAVRSTIDATLVLQHKVAGVWATVVNTPVIEGQVVSPGGTWDTYARAGRASFRAAVDTADLSSSEIATCSITRSQAGEPVPAPAISSDRSGFCRTQSDGRVVARAAATGVLYLQVKTDDGWRVVLTLRAEEGTTTAYPETWKSYVLDSGQAQMRVVFRDRSGWSEPVECAISTDQT